MSATAYVGLGANLGRPVEQVTRALEELGRLPQCTELVASGLYDSAPVGPPQPRYVNAVARLGWSGNAEELFEALVQVERAFGRARGEKWAPRTLDLDLLSFGDQVVTTRELTVPHPRLHERRFVLEPLAELAPGWVHPLLGVSAQQLLRRLAPQDVVRI